MDTARMKAAEARCAGARRALRHARGRFRFVFSVLSERGACDAVDSAQYRRLLNVWSVTEAPAPSMPLADWIYLEANRPPPADQVDQSVRQLDVNPATTAGAGGVG